MYPFERFTEGAKKALALAQEEAERSHHSYIGSEHLLLGLLREGEGVAAKILNNLGVEIDRVRSAIDSVLGRNERIIIQQIIPTSRTKKVIEISFDEARRMGNTYVGTEHLLLGLLIEGEGIAAHVLKDLGAGLDAVRSELQRLLAEGGQGEAPSEPSFGTTTLPPRLRRNVVLMAMLAEIERGAERLAAEQRTQVHPEHLVLALLGHDDPLLRRVLAALGIDEAKIAAARRIASPPERLVGLRRAFEARAAEIGGWRPDPSRPPVWPAGHRVSAYFGPSGGSPGQPAPGPPGDQAEMARARRELEQMRRELKEAERRWRAGEDLDDVPAEGSGRQAEAGGGSEAGGSEAGTSGDGEPGSGGSDDGGPGGGGP